MKAKGTELQPPYSPTCSRDRFLKTSLVYLVMTLMGCNHWNLSNSGILQEGAFDPMFSIVTHEISRKHLPVKEIVSYLHASASST